VRLALGDGTDAALSVRQEEEPSRQRKTGKALDAKGREFADDVVLANVARDFEQGKPKEEKRVVRLDRRNEEDEQKKSGRPSELFVQLKEANQALP